MKTKSKRTLTPKLRFPEFRDKPGWKEQKLGEIVALEYGSPLPEKDRKGGPFPVIGSNGIVGYHDKAIVDGPAIVVGRKGSAGQVNLIESDCYPIDTTFFVKNIDPESCPIAFLWRLLERSNLERLGDSGAVPGLNRNEVYLLKTYIPFPPEQQKIADCLSSLDGVIAAEGRKLAALRDHKRGLMQQLFPQPGQTQPRLRFPEFRDRKPWKNKEVGDVFDIKRGQVLAMPLVRDIESIDMPYPVYSSRTKDQGLSGYYSEYLFEDAITWTTDGANAGDVNYRPGKFYCTNVCGVLLSDEGYANLCIAALLNSVTRDHVSYVGNPKLMNGVMAKIVIPFPEHDEQQRISDCLSALDTLIAAQAEKIDALKTHKRGLMQQLFPAPEEQL